MSQRLREVSQQLSQQLMQQLKPEASKLRWTSMFAVFWFMRLCLMKV
jgi:hypothetical protein